MSAYPMRGRSETAERGAMNCNPRPLICRHAETESPMAKSGGRRQTALWGMARATSCVFQTVCGATPSPKPPAGRPAPEWSPCAPISQCCRTSFGRSRLPTKYGTRRSSLAQQQPRPPQRCWHGVLAPGPLGRGSNRASLFEMDLPTVRPKLPQHLAQSDIDRVLMSSHRALSLPLCSPNYQNPTRASLGRSKWRRLLVTGSGRAGGRWRR